MTDEERKGAANRIIEKHRLIYTLMLTFQAAAESGQQVAPSTLRIADELNRYIAGIHKGSDIHDQ